MGWFGMVCFCYAKNLLVGFSGMVWFSMVWYGLVSQFFLGGTSGMDWFGQTDADRQTDVCLSDYPSVCLPIKK